MVAMAREAARIRGLPRYLPTPAEISARCAEIREQWTAAETRRRWVRSVSSCAWFPPVSHVPIRRRHG